MAGFRLQSLPLSLKLWTLRTGISSEARIASFAGGHWGGSGGRKVGEDYAEEVLGGRKGTWVELGLASQYCLHRLGP